jgi:ABC-type Fe3+/spermidine/putrescine transport system ATPase subunit
MSNNDDFISIANVSKHFGSVVAVDNININISRGEFFSLLGASGCGKTTLLRMLAGFETPTTGEIYIDGAPMSEMAPHHRPTNMVFQNYAIFPHLNVRSNIAFGLRADKLSKAEANRRVDEVDVRRPTPARRPGARADQAPEGTVAGRAAGGARQKAP